MQNKIIKIFFLLAIFFAWSDFASAGITNISTCQDLNIPNETYVLQNDVSSEGTCFSIIGSGIILDLNNNNVIYDNAPKVNVSNSSFEDTDMSNWNLVDAINTTRMIGSYVQPVAVSSGSYSLMIPTPTVDQIIKTTEEVALKANTVYGLSLMYANSVSATATISISFEGVGMDGGSASYKPSQGMGFLSGRYKTGTTDELRRIIITVSNAGEIPTGNIYIDDVRVSSLKQPGIIIGPQSYRVNPPYDTNSHYPNYTGAFGNAYGAIVKNGTLMQGSNAGDYSHGIVVGGNSTVSMLDNLSITTNGIAASDIWTSGNLNDSEISNCVFNMLTRVNPNRQAYLGANVKFDSPTVGLKFHHNNILTGLQSGLVTNSITGTVTRNDISFNTISLQSNSSNDFAIIANGSDIHDNIIDCGSGDNSCRGIWGGGISNWATGTRVYNNAISVQQLKRNQEYNGCELKGAYGIQIEETINAEIFNNTVTAIASSECEAHALRINPNTAGDATTPVPAADLNNIVHDNIFIAVGNDSVRASSMKLTGITSGSVNVFNNTFKTNSRWIYVDDFPVVSDVVFTGNRWETNGILPTVFHPFEVYTYYNSLLWASRVVPVGTHFNGIFIDNKYGNIAGSPEEIMADKLRFETNVFRSTVGWPNSDSSSDFSVVASDVIASSAPSGLSVQ